MPLGVVVAAAAAGSVVFAATRPPAEDVVGRGAGRGTPAVVRAAGPTFAAGACVALEPRAAWNGRTVFLDAGHGGLDTGAVATVGGRTVNESALTLAITRRAAALLRRRGYRVVVSRTGNSTVARLGRGATDGRLLTAAAVHRDVIARNLCANAARVQALVSVHLNSFADPAVSGTETIYNANRPFRTRNRRLAGALQRALVASLARGGRRSGDRGVVTDGAGGGAALTAAGAAYGQLLELGPAKPPWFREPTRMPGAVAEPLFLTHPDEARLALAATGQSAIARGLAEGLRAYFG